MAEKKNRSILIEHIDGSETLVEDIPENAKITFGPIQPGRGGYGSGEVLRIYTSASNQLAVFRNVLSFRDLSLSVKTREITSARMDSEYVHPDGSTRSHVATVEKGPFAPKTLDW